MGCIMSFESQLALSPVVNGLKLNVEVVDGLYVTKGFRSVSPNAFSEPSNESKKFNLLEELNPEDDMIGRKNAVKRHLTKHIPNYLVDVVLRFLGTRDYSLITKPKYTIRDESLTYPGGVTFIKQKLLAVGY